MATLAHWNSDSHVASKLFKLQLTHRSHTGLFLTKKLVFFILTALKCSLKDQNPAVDTYTSEKRKVKLSNLDQFVI